MLTMLFWHRNIGHAVQFLGRESLLIQHLVNIYIYLLIFIYMQTDEVVSGSGDPQDTKQK